MSGFLSFLSFAIWGQGGGGYYCYWHGVALSDAWLYLSARLIFDINRQSGLKQYWLFFFSLFFLLYWLLPFFYEIIKKRYTTFLKPPLGFEMSFKWPKSLNTNIYDMQTFSFSLLDFTSTVHTFFFIFRYCLWLLECSHMTGRQYAIMFFGLAVPYLNVLQIFDHQVCFIKVCNFFSLKNFFAPIMKGEGGCNVSSHDITAIFWVLLLQ